MGGCAMTIYESTEGYRFVLLAEVPLPERVLLEVFLVGLERPPVEGGVFLTDFLAFKSQQRALRRKRAQE